MFLVGRFAPIFSNFLSGFIMTQATNTKRAITTSISKTTQSVIFQFSHGAELIFSLTDLEKLPDGGSDMILELALHGAKQKIQDAAAIACDTSTGKSATVEAKYQACLKVVENLRAGVWSAKSTGGKSNQDDMDLLQALVNLYGEAKRDAVTAKFETFTAADKRKLKAQPKVALELAKILQERGENAKDDDADILGLDIEDALM